jgi:hypothetical protein
MQVNSISVEAEICEERFILIKNQKILGKNLLHKGKNRIAVLYSGEYDKSG